VPANSTCKDRLGADHRMSIAPRCALASNCMSWKGTMSWNGGVVPFFHERNITHERHINIEVISQIAPPQQVSVLRFYSSIARANDNHALLSLIMAACQHLGHTLNSVLGATVSTAPPQVMTVDHDGRLNISPETLAIAAPTLSAARMPPQIIQLISTSPTYCAARIMHSGRPMYLANKRFKDEICSDGDVRKTWQSGEGEGIETFVAPGSLPAFFKLAATGFKRAFGTPDELVMVPGEVPVQIRTYECDYAPFALRTWHLARGEEYTMAFEAVPLLAPLPAGVPQQQQQQQQQQQSPTCSGQPGMTAAVMLLQTMGAAPQQLMHAAPRLMLAGEKVLSSSPSPTPSRLVSTGSDWPTWTAAAPEAHCGGSYATGGSHPLCDDPAILDEATLESFLRTINDDELPTDDEPRVPLNELILLSSTQDGTNEPCQNASSPFPQQALPSPFPQQALPSPFPERASAKRARV